MCAFKYVGSKTNTKGEKFARTVVSNTLETGWQTMGQAKSGWQPVFGNILLKYSHTY